VEQVSNNNIIPLKGRRVVMLDTTPVTKEMTRLIAAGTTEDALLIAVAVKFPELTIAELSAALQEATAAAERKAVSAKH
jgi:hypothetical protein